jgi:hypothetical protein
MSAAFLLAAGVAGGSVAIATAASAAGTPTHSYQTRVESYRVPATHEIHSTLRISGTVQVRNGSAWKAADDLWVDYLYRTLPSGKWINAGVGKTSTRGVFNTPVNVRLGHIAWQVKVKQQQVGDNLYLASSSGTRDTFVTDRTYVTHFVAMHLSGATDLAAIMQDWPQSGGVSYATVTGVAKFYYHPKGTSTWRYLGSARTDNSGSVAYDLRGTVNGYFRVVFPAQSFFLSSTSNTEYLG